MKKTTPEVTPLKNRGYLYEIIKEPQFYINITTWVWCSEGKERKNSLFL